MVMVAVPLLSVAVGASKLQAVPCSTILLVLPQVMTGAVVSTMMTFWLQVLLLPQASATCQVRVASRVVPQWPVVLVTVLILVVAVLLMLTVAAGGAKRQAAPWSIIVLVLLQVMTGRG